MLTFSGKNCKKKFAKKFPESPKSKRNSYKVFRKVEIAVEETSGSSEELA